jgi:hypothetical protein
LDWPAAPAATRRTATPARVLGEARRVRIEQDGFWHTEPAGLQGGVIVLQGDFDDATNVCSIDADAFLRVIQGALQTSEVDPGYGTSR